MTGFCKQSGNCEAGVGWGAGTFQRDALWMKSALVYTFRRSDGLCVGVWGRSALQGYSRKLDT